MKQNLNWMHPGREEGFAIAEIYVHLEYQALPLDRTWNEMLWTLRFQTFWVKGLDNVKKGIALSKKNE